LTTSLLGALVFGGFALGASGATAAPRPSGQLKVDISVPSALVSNGRHVWIANTGSSSVLELDAATGRELRNVAGSTYRFDISDAIATYGDHVWVANSASNSVTVFHASTGKLIRVLSGPAYQFEVPSAMVVADHHVFVLNGAGSRVTELDETTGRRLRVLTGPLYRFAGTHAMVVVHHDVWTANGAGKGSLTEFNAVTAKVVRVISSGSARLDAPTSLASDGIRLWVSNALGGHISEVAVANGHLMRTISNSTHQLSGLDSLAWSGRTLWGADQQRSGLVLAFDETSGKTTVVLAHRFGFPAVSADAHHIWVVDRTQSRVTELNPATGAIVRVITN
jgi:outer membrane protein assembly factor BamB